ncbi:MAG TPA: phosphoglycerate mutase, partial [Calditrichia bacterium]|nr:phosphoglycerate mutase [Calditrichia bacterium]
ETQIGRGVLSALGVDFELTGKDVAARLNFCTLDGDGKVSDRRAGRIPTETNLKLCEKIRANVKLPGVEYFLMTESEHRAVLVIRGEGLGGNINDTDPQVTGAPPRKAEGEDPASRKSAEIFENFFAQVREVLKDDHPANMVLARGFAKFDPLPTMEDRFGLRSAAIAQYPMYRGLARLVGMSVLPKPDTYQAMWESLQQHYNDYDFFFVHFKKTDSTGEDGNFDEKVKKIEEIDRWVAQVESLNPEVIIITGDHSTPSYLKNHSWHPVPTLLYSKQCRPDRVTTFGERDCNAGGIGRMATKHLMMLAMANALRLKKFGA